MTKFKNNKATINNRRKPHMTTDTSMQSYKECIEKRTIETQEGRVFQNLKDKGKATAAQLEKRTSQRRTSLCKSLRNLQDKGKIYVIDKVKCEFTGRTVQRYELVEREKVSKTTLMVNLLPIIFTHYLVL